MDVVVKRFDVYLVDLNPTVGFEIQKTRPCLIISPDVINLHLGTVIVAPMTTKVRDYPSRVKVHFDGKEGQIVLDQLRTIDKGRLAKKLGHISQSTQNQVLAVLQEMFLK
jgi:mRNA interferase MazF